MSRSTVSLRAWLTPQRQADQSAPSQQVRVKNKTTTASTAKCASYQSHRRVQHVNEFLGFRAAAESEGAGSQQPIAQENVATLDPIDPRNVLEIDNLGVLATESALLEHLDAVGIDLNVFNLPEPLSWNSRVLLSMRVTPRVELNQSLTSHFSRFETSSRKRRTASQSMSLRGLKLNEV